MVAPTNHRSVHKYLPVGIRVVQERLNGSQDGRDIIRRAPAVLKNVEAKLSVCIDVRVEHLGQELDMGRARGIRLVKSED